MKFSLSHSLQVLSATPAVLRDMLGGLSSEWTGQNEGPDTWSPYDIVGHLIHGEQADWIPRARLILESEGEVPEFAPFDRFAQFRKSRGKSLEDLLSEFSRLRRENIATLRSWNLESKDLELLGRHPDLGEVNMRQLLATWTVHDLSHIAQIGRVMARQYSGEVGPWAAYLPILQRK
ncbi:MAG: DinB family protein [Saprospiraceae bacterium]|nr:DinB family protein [Saprospiraceae bacterium]